MRQGTYLNVILTVNAVLLSGILWGQLASRSLLSTEAAAQSTSPGGSPSLIPVSAADQRQRQVEALRDIKATVDAMHKTLQSGKLKVEVTNFDQMPKD